MPHAFRPASLLPLALLPLLVAAGCKSPPSTGGGSQAAGASSSSGPSFQGAPSYRLITNGISPFWDSMDRGMVAAQQALKVNAQWLGPNPSNNAEQVRIMNDAMAAGVNGIGISAIAPDALSNTIDTAVGRGIPVICFDSDAPQSKRLAYLGTNNYEAGQLLGAQVRKLMPQGGKLIAFVGTMSQKNAIDRYQGLQDALKGSGITFLAPPYEDNQDKETAIRNVDDALTKYQPQGLSGLVGLYSYDGPAILESLQHHGLIHKLKVICFDGDPTTLQGLKDGTVDVTVVQKPYEFGRLSIELLNLLHQGNDIDSALEKLKPELTSLKMTVNMQKHTINTGVTVVTPATAAPFLQDLKEKGIAST